MLDTAIIYYIFFLTAYNVPDLEKKPTATVIRPLRGHLSTVIQSLQLSKSHIGGNFGGGGVLVIPSELIVMGRNFPTTSVH